MAGRARVSCWSVTKDKELCGGAEQRSRKFEQEMKEIVTMRNWKPGNLPQWKLSALHCKQLYLHVVRPVAVLLVGHSWASANFHPSVVQVFDIEQRKMVSNMHDAM